jgi:hypothetical protein
MLLQGLLIIAATLFTMWLIAYLMYFISRAEAELRAVAFDTSAPPAEMFLAFVLWVPVGIVNLFLKVLTVISFGYLLNRALHHEE